MKRINWLLLILVLVGFVIGRFIGSYFEGTFLNYGESFGLSSPVVLNLGFFCSDLRADDPYHHRQRSGRSNRIGGIPVYQIVLDASEKVEGDAWQQKEQRTYQTLRKKKRTSCLTKDSCGSGRTP